MKKQIPQYIMIFVLAIVITMALPASFAKYASSKTFTVNLKREIEEEPDQKLWVFPGESSPLTVPATGYYAIIAKGGDGADGFEREQSHDFFTRKGGTGGTVMAIFKLKKNDVLYLYPGTDGNRPSTDDDAVLGTGGTNGSGYCSGGSGDDDLSTTGLIIYDTANELSSSLASGGGGAASLVYLNNKSNANLLIVAGGGGGAGSQDNGSWAMGATVYNAHNGGNGGSNISNAGGYASESYSGTVYPGGDSSGGTYGDSEWGTAIGFGGSKDTYNQLGTGGYTKSITWPLLGTVPEGNGGDGKYIDDNGNGGDSDEYGGGGGGGFCGGGAGTGTSLNTGAGGGGGGSSFIAASSNGIAVSTDTSDYASIIKEASSKLPTQKGNTTVETIKYGFLNRKSLSKNVYADYGDGYIIVKYLGKTLS